ncbi:flagellar FlbD family protein [Pasteurella multocida]|uniref:flagellar FlbD family protein n=1 Tax=Pasteurella multocida TaxID=747 RepID=UPI0023016AA4|nr:flagellar FlbD family protein [Pasteurella multocida]MDA5607085.1 flagellar FlbD family protein [Pasteurella multocida subsp. multocida]MDA5614652.1 flagellar FlbD family protein [Pasteurella multocida]MDA5624625.1 flagellar FlbD family protein [Pasteurella multocida]
MAIIKLTQYLGNSILINTNLIETVKPEYTGCVINTVHEKGISVRENLKEVLSLIQANQEETNQTKIV